MPRRNYQAKLAADNVAVLERSRNARDIADEYPGPGDLVTRAACERNLRLFCETYFPNAFKMAWSDDHLKVIARMEDIVLNGGLLALAMPRGGGKTTLSVRAAMWALLYGHRRFVCLVAATEDLAKGLLKSIKTELAFNDRLAADFRQVCYPLKRLENNGRKSIGQLFDGEQTRIEWGSDRLAFPTVPDEACDGVNVSGATISVAGLTGAIRGQQTTLASGVIIRPELVILDDPQTRESAMSLSQCDTRAAIITGDVLGMAGPDQSIAAIMPCTVVRAGDMSDQLLDRKKNPEWGGIRTKMVVAFPTNEKRWEDYARLWSDGLQAERGIGEATEYYREHRDEMDEGSVLAWPARYRKDEISALQCAMNLKLRGPAAFYAEYQNEPLVGEDAAGDDLTADQIASKVNRIPRALVPAGCTRLTMMVDVQGSLLYWVVAGWNDDFSGFVVDYGTYPDQKRAYFTLRDAQYKFDTEMKGKGVEEQIYAALETLTDDLMGRDWEADGGAPMRIDRGLIDAGFMTEVVNQFCRQSKHRDRLTPSHGRGIKASSLPINQLEKRPGDRFGLNWRSRPVEGKGSVRYVAFDANFWKSFVMARLAVGMGGRGCLSLFGDKPGQHRLFADHLAAEYRVRTEGRGRTIDEWKLRVERPDNHWLDGIVGCAVAASMQGAQLTESTTDAASKPKRVSFADMRAAKRA